MKTPSETPTPAPSVTPAGLTELDSMDHARHAQTLVEYARAEQGLTARANLLAEAQVFATLAVANAIHVGNNA